MEKRTHIPYGYKTYTGYIMAKAHVDSYNAIQARINSFIDAGMPVPEYLLHASFQTLNDCARLAFVRVA
jgi:hypothetical protein